MPLNKSQLTRFESSNKTENFDDNFELDIWIRANNLWLYWWNNIKRLNVHIKQQDGHNVSNYLKI